MCEAQNIPDRFPATLADRVAYLLRGRIESGVGNFVISLLGRVDESRLGRAVRLAMDAEPVLGCRFVEHRFHPCFQRRTDLDQLPLCTVVEAHCGGTPWAGFLAESLDPTRDPMLKVVVFRGARDTVCMKASHVAADGPSLGRVFPMLADLYRRLGADADYRPPPNAVGERTLRRFIRQFTAAERLRFASAFVRGLRAPRPAWLFPTVAQGKGYHGYLLLRLPPERVGALSRYGRDRRATMTAVMLAGFYRAARAVFGLACREAASFYSTTDLRRFLPDEHRRTAISNMSAPAHFCLDPRRDGDFDQVLAAIRDQLRAIVKDPTRISTIFSLLIACPPLVIGLDLLPFSFLRAVVDRQVAKLWSRPERRWTLANLGEIDPELIDLQDVGMEDAFATAPVYSGPGLGVAVSIFRNTLTMALGLSGEVMAESDARNLLEQVDLALPFHSLAPGKLLVLPANAHTS